MTDLNIVPIYLFKLFHSCLILKKLSDTVVDVQRMPESKFTPDLKIGQSTSGIPDTNKKSKSGNADSVEVHSIEKTASRTICVISWSGKCKMQKGPSLYYVSKNTEWVGQKNGNYLQIFVTIYADKE